MGTVAFLCGTPSSITLTNKPSMYDPACVYGVDKRVELRTYPGAEKPIRQLLQGFHRRLNRP